jgi:hypothetical protein
MATYVPNATQTTEPVESQTVESAALEFRTLKTRVNALAALVAADDLTDLRVPEASVAVLPAVAERAGKVLGFDAGGDPTMVEVAGATDPSLRSDLAASSGASLVGYLPDGVGAVATTVQEKLRESVSVKDFGAVGDGAADDTAAIQAAIGAAGVGGLLFFPYTSTGYLASSLQMLDGQTWVGTGRDSPGIVGDGTAVLVKTNTYLSGVYPVRNVHFSNLQITNTNFDAVQLHVAPDSSIQHCRFECTGASALSQIRSVRCAINANQILSSGAATTWKILDNCNGTDGSNNTVSPGTSASG